MKIKLEIDDKYKDANLYLMWGMVPIARYKVNKKYWEIKTGFCSQCGRCCKEKKVPFYEDGKCKYLVEDPGNGINCSLKSSRPFGCCIADALIPTCTVRWE